MPLKQTQYGGICPLGKFKIEHGIGAYDKDPVEACLKCGFDTPGESDLEKSCKCPAGMTWDDYDKLQKDFFNTSMPRTKLSFQQYVSKNYPVKIKNEKEVSKVPN